MEHPPTVSPETFEITLNSAFPADAAARFPIPLTPLIDRDNEVNRVVALLQDPTARLVTITGLGGVGKSRVAVEAVQRTRLRFDGGLIFFDGTRLPDGELVLPTLISTLRDHLTSAATSLDELHRDLAGRRLLIILSSWERLPEGDRWIAMLATHLPTIQVLVTSRRAFGLQGEHLVPVGPLPLPAPDAPLESLQANPAVRLFVDRVNAVRPPFALTADNAAAVVDIVRQLDGIPLAIELAAGRTRLFHLSAIQTRLTDPLTLLTNGPRNLPERHRTMRDAIRWSYEALSPAAQATLRRLSAFASVFSINGARAVAASVIDTTEALDDVLTELLTTTMLLRAEVGEEATNYRIPGVYRAYAREELVRLGEVHRARLDVLNHYRRTLTRVQGDLLLSVQNQALQRVEWAEPNIVAAIEAALDDGAGQHEAIELLTLMSRFWLIRGRYALCAELLERGLATAIDLPPGMRMVALRHLGMHLWEMDRPGRAEACFVQALALAEEHGNQREVAAILNSLGVIRLRDNHLDEAEQLLTRAIAIRRELDDTTYLPSPLNNLGDIAQIRGDYGLASRYYEDAYEIRAARGNAWGVVLSTHALITNANLLQQWEEADTWFKIGCQFAQEVGFDFGVGTLYLLHALGLYQRNRVLEAISATLHAIETLQGVESQRVLLEALPQLARACLAIGRETDGAMLLGAYTAQRNATTSLRRHTPHTVQRVEDDIRSRIGEETWRRYHLIGTHQMPAQALVITREIFEQALLERTQSAPMSDTPATAPKLTRREHDVLELIVAGLADKAIAEKLGISPRTVMTHVSNILGKLGVHNRAAASRVAMLRGLVARPAAGGRRAPSADRQQ